MPRNRYELRVRASSEEFSDALSEIRHFVIDSVAASELFTERLAEVGGESGLVSVSTEPKGNCLIIHLKPNPA